MPEHTPGPWEWVGDELDGNGGDICHTVLEVQDTPENNYPEMQSGELIMPNEAADRALIAAAPDLLAAVEDMRIDLNKACSVAGVALPISYERAGAALDKARGESNA